MIGDDKNITKSIAELGRGWRFGDSWPGQRCLAKTRRGTKCRRPAYKKSGKCHLHGGASSGPKTQQGIENIKKAQTTHGNFSKEAIKERKELACYRRQVQSEIKEIETWAIDAGLLEKNWRRMFD